MAEEKTNLQKLSDAFQALTFREMKDLSEVLTETLKATNGVIVKPDVMAEVLDAFGEYLVVEGEKD